MVTIGSELNAAFLVFLVQSGIWRMWGILERNCDRTMIPGNIWARSYYSVWPETLLYCCALRRSAPQRDRNGKVAEWSNALDSKSSVRLGVPSVRIRPFPPKIQIVSSTLKTALLGLSFYPVRDFLPIKAIASASVSVAR